MEALLALGAVAMVILSLIGVFMIVVMWILFTKAGEPGWAILIPIYNILVLLKISGKPWWWIFGIFLSIIPFIGWIGAIAWGFLIVHGISLNFGKDIGYTFGLYLLGFIFFPILAFGNATYNPVPSFGSVLKEDVPVAS